MGRWLPIVVLLATASVARADGKLYGREHPPPIPYQRALVHHANGRELLVVQSKYVGPPEELAWVVPSHAPPVCGALASDALFASLARNTAPRIVRLGWMAETALFTALTILLVIRGIRASREGRRAVPYLVAALFAVTLWALLESPALRGDRYPVETIRAQQVGIYDVQVVRAADPEALLKWLAAGGFAHGGEDREAIAAYVSRGYCFATVRVRAGEKSATPHSEDRMTDPLVLAFDAPQAVYPLALTAATGAPAEVLLYVAGDGRMEADARFAVEYSGPEAAGIDWEGLFAKADPSDLFAKAGGGLRAAKRVTKLRATLAPEEMKEDATLVPAGTGETFRKRLFRW